MFNLAKRLISQILRRLACGPRKGVLGMIGAAYFDVILFLHFLRRLGTG